MDSVLKELYSAITSEGTVDYEFLIGTLVNRAKEFKSKGKPSVTSIGSAGTRNVSNLKIQQKPALSALQVKNVYQAQTDLLSTASLAKAAGKNVNDALIHEMLSHLKSKEDIEILSKFYEFISIGDGIVDHEELLSFLVREGKILQSRISAFKHQKPRFVYSSSTSNPSDSKYLENNVKKLVDQDQVSKNLDSVYAYQEGKEIDAYIESLILTPSKSKL